MTIAEPWGLPGEVGAGRIIMLRGNVALVSEVVVNKAKASNEAFEPSSCN